MTFLLSFGVEKCVIKFSGKPYPVDLHNLLVKEEMIPLLFGYQEFSGVHAVVMELLEDSEYFNEKHDHLRGPVSAAVDLMHNAGWVHGDLRDANILVKSDKVYFIDFEWAGKPDNPIPPRYPASLSERIWTSEIRISKGIYPGGLITKEHDRYMPSRLLDQ